MDKNTRPRTYSTSYRNPMTFPEENKSQTMIEQMLRERSSDESDDSDKYAPRKDQNLSVGATSGACLLTAPDMTNTPPKPQDNNNVYLASHQAMHNPPNPVQLPIVENVWNAPMMSSRVSNSTQGEYLSSPNLVPYQSGAKRIAPLLKDPVLVHFPLEDLLEIYDVSSHSQDADNAMLIFKRKLDEMYLSTLIADHNYSEEKRVCQDVPILDEPMTLSTGDSICQGLAGTSPQMPASQPHGQKGLTEDIFKGLASSHSQVENMASTKRTVDGLSSDDVMALFKTLQGYRSNNPSPSGFDVLQSEEGLFDQNLEASNTKQQGLVSEVNQNVKQCNNEHNMSAKKSVLESLFYPDTDQQVVARMNTADNTPEEDSNKFHVNLTFVNQPQQQPGTFSLVSPKSHSDAPRSVLEPEAIELPQQAQSTLYSYVQQNPVQFSTIDFSQLNFECFSGIDTCGISVKAEPQVALSLPTQQEQVVSLPENQLQPLVQEELLSAEDLKLLLPKFCFRLLHHFRPTKGQIHTLLNRFQEVANAYKRLGDPKRSKLCFLLMFLENEVKLWINDSQNFDLLMILLTLRRCAKNRNIARDEIALLGTVYYIFVYFFESVFNDGMDAQQVAQGGVLKNMQVYHTFVSDFNEFVKRPKLGYNTKNRWHYFVTCFLVAIYHPGYLK